MKPLAKAVWGMSKALLAEAPGGKVLGPFADPIFNAVLDSASDSEASLEEVLKRMGAIVSEELTEHDIAKLKGKVADIRQWLNIQYKAYVLLLSWATLTHTWVALAAQGGTGALISRATSFNNISSIVMSLLLRCLSVLLVPPTLSRGVTSVPP